jgi:hypothetical protein
VDSEDYQVSFYKNSSESYFSLITLIPIFENYQVQWWVRNKLLTLSVKNNFSHFNIFTKWKIYTVKSCFTQKKRIQGRHLLRTCMFFPLWFYHDKQTTLLFMILINHFLVMILKPPKTACKLCQPMIWRVGNFRLIILLNLQRAVFSIFRTYQF